MADQNRSYILTNLITNLCQVLYNDYLNEKSIDGNRVVENEAYKRNIKKLRSQVFQILLQGSNNSINCTHEENINLSNLNLDNFLTNNKDGHVNFDASKLMDEYFFIMKFHYHNDHRVYSNLMKCENYYKTMKNKDHPLFKKSNLFLLAYIRKNKFYNENDFYETVVNDSNNNKTFSCPAPFTLNASHEDKKLFDLTISYSFDEAPITFHDITALKHQQNEYINGISKKNGLLLNHKRNVDNMADANVCAFFFRISNKRDSKPTPLNTNQTAIKGTFETSLEEGFRSPPDVFESLLPSNLPHFQSSSQHPLETYNECIPVGSADCYLPEFSTNDKDSNIFALETQEAISDLIEENQKVKSWNWENLSSDTISTHRSFVSEHFCSTHLHCYENRFPCRKFQVNVISLQDFLTTLKFLTVGVSSDIFYICNEDVNESVFTMLPNTTVENCLPSTTKLYALHFLMIGTCFRRLREMVKTSRKPQHKVNGFIYKALCDGIDEYLALFRKFVYMENDHTLLGYYKRIKHLMNPLENLTALMCVHPNSTFGSEYSPLGAKLLTYLCTEITRTSDEHFLNLLVYILRQCCSVYFQHLHRWVFYGCLDDPYNELFIGHLNHYRLNTRYFYERSYFIREDCVPHFIDKFSKDILLCGKYTMLLKSCKPNHPIFKVEYPKLQVGLQYEDISSIKVESERYNRQARAQCGSVVEISEIMSRKKNRFKQLKEAFQQKAKRNLDTGNENILNENQNCKNLILEDLKANMEETKKKKLDERKSQLVEKLLFKKMHEDNEMKLLEKEHEQLKKNLKVNQDLEDSIDMKNKQSLSKPYELKESTKHCEDSEKNNCSLAGRRKSDTEDCSSSNPNDQAKSIDANTKANAKLTISNNNNSEIVNKIINIFETSPLKNILKGSNTAKSNPDLINNNIKDELKKNRTKMLQSTIGLPNQNDLLTRTLNKSYLNDKGIEIRDRYQTSNIFNAITDLNINNNISSFRTVSPVEVLTDSQKNRSKILNSQIFVANTLKAQNCKSRSDLKLDLMDDYVKTKENDIGRTINVYSSERARNKAKVFRLEFGLNEDSPKPELKQRTNAIELERTRNKLKVLSSEFDIGFKMDSGKTHSDKLKKVPTLKVDTERTGTEKLSALECEKSTSILDPSSASKALLSVNDPNNALTPMSTTSDQSPYPECPSSIDVNGNIAEKHNNQTELKFNMENANAEATPSTNLSSNELDLPRDFISDISEHNQFLNNVSKSANLSKDSDNILQSYDNELYQRTLDLLASNFQCNSSNLFIRQHNNDVKSNCLSVATNSCENQRTYWNELQRMGNKKTCPVRITQYLQKSIMLPVKVHLELVRNEVLRLFFEDYDLMQHFRNLKNYFFMMNGEFGARVCQGIFKRFENGVKPSQLFYYPTLHSILDNALFSGSHTTDKAKSCAAQVSFVVSEVPESFDAYSPYALYSLTLTYEVHWPLNIILNSETIEKYGNIFKFLFLVRRMDYILDISYGYLKDAVAKHGRALLVSTQYVYIQFIRHKVHIFIKALKNHITASAIQSSWIQFKKEISQAKCLEEIYRIHTNYIKKITFLCMMNRKSRDFFDLLEKIFKIIIRFCKNLKRSEFKLGENGQFSHDRYERLLKDEADFQRLIIYMVYLGKKIVRKGYQSEIGQLIDLININDYYSTANMTSNLISCPANESLSKNS